jgi:hypothetical protein
VNNRYALWECIDPQDAHKKFRIVEAYETCDGPRWRITDRCFNTKLEAMYCLEKMRVNQT